MAPRISQNVHFVSFMIPHQASTLPGKKVLPRQQRTRQALFIKSSAKQTKVGSCTVERQGRISCDSNGHTIMLRGVFIYLKLPRGIYMLLSLPAPLCGYAICMPIEVIVFEVNELYMKVCPYHVERYSSLGGKKPEARMPAHFAHFSVFLRIF